LICEKDANTKSASFSGCEIAWVYYPNFVCSASAFGTPSAYAAPEFALLTLLVPRMKDFRDFVMGRLRCLTASVLVGKILNKILNTISIPYTYNNSQNGENRPRFLIFL